MQVPFKLVLTIKKHGEEVRVGLDMRHTSFPHDRVVLLGPEQVEGQAPKLAVAVAAHLVRR